MNRHTMRTIVVSSVTGVALAVATGSAAARGVVPQEGSTGPEGLGFVASFGWLVLAPVGLFLLIAAVVLGPSAGKNSRRKPGAAVESGPVWVGGGSSDGTLDEPVLGDPGTADPHSEVRTGKLNEPDVSGRGGASGRW